MEHGRAHARVRGKPQQRPLTYRELQELFDWLDARIEQIEQIVRLGRKGTLAAWRDTTRVKTTYGFGCAATSLPVSM